MFERKDIVESKLLISVNYSDYGLDLAIFAKIKKDLQPVNFCLKFNSQEISRAKQGFQAVTG